MVYINLYMYVLLIHNMQFFIYIFYMFILQKTTMWNIQILSIPNLNIK